MEWKTTYRNKIVSADEAVRQIRNNELVSLGHAAGVPQMCVDALIRNYKWFKNVSIYHMLVLGDAFGDQREAGRFSSCFPLRSTPHDS